jgi:hypothetical protein
VHRLPSIGRGSIRALSTWTYSSSMLGQLSNKLSIKPLLSFPSTSSLEPRLWGLSGSSVASGGLPCPSRALYYTEGGYFTQYVRPGLKLQSPEHWAVAFFFGWALLFACGVYPRPNRLCTLFSKLPPFVSFSFSCPDDEDGE